MAKRAFVIVHGAWTGGWSWERVLECLRQAGHRAFAPTLTGLCERRHLAGPNVNLDTHIEDIVNEVLFKDLSDIVLVAHSYGGLVATGVAERIDERIGSIVFLEAIIPEDGTSFADVMPWDDYAEPMIAAPPSSPGDYLREADRAWVDGKTTAQPLGTFTQKLAVTGAYQRLPKKTFIVATGWEGAFEAAANRFARDPSWMVRAIACGHDVPVDMPDELTALLIEAAGEPAAAASASGRR